MCPYLSAERGILQIEFDFRFTDAIQVMCLWDKEDLPTEDLNIVGQASTEITIPQYFKNCNVPTTQITSRSSNIASEECEIYHKRPGENQLCYGNSLYVVPGSCTLDQGGPIVKPLNNSKFKSAYYQIGINIEGKDCGFGYPTIATRVSRYIDWIDSVIFGKATHDTKNAGLIALTESNLSSCKLPTGGRGACQKSSQCRDVVKMITMGQVLFKDYVCDAKNLYDPAICCPT